MNHCFSFPFLRSSKIISVSLQSHWSHLHWSDSQMLLCSDRAEAAISTNHTHHVTDMKLTYMLRLWLFRTAVFT